MPAEQKTRTIEGLRNTRVYTVDKIVIRWCIKSLHPGEQEVIFGRDDDGRSAHVVYSIARKAFDVYLEDRRTSSFPPYDLITAIQTCLSIPDAHSNFLSMVLTQANLNDIEDTLRRNSIPQLRDLRDDSETSLTLSYQTALLTILDRTIRQQRIAKQAAQINNLNSHICVDETRPSSGAASRPHRPLNDIEDVLWPNRHLFNPGLSTPERHPAFLPPAVHASESSLQEGMFIAKTRARVKTSPDSQLTTPAP